MIRYEDSIFIENLYAVIFVFAETLMLLAQKASQAHVVWASLN